MKKNALIMLMLTIFFLLTACSYPTKIDALTEVATQVEQALPSEYVKQYEMETYRLFTATDGEGHDLEYYMVVTTYYAADPAEATELHTEAFSAVFDVENADCVKTFDAAGHPAAIYSLGDHHYACCTSTPEVSAVMKYVPGFITEEEAMLTIRSIFEDVDPEKDLKNPE